MGDPGRFNARSGPHFLSNKVLLPSPILGCLWRRPADPLLGETEGLRSLIFLIELVLQDDVLMPSP
jgi:hypothetical protein